MSSSSDIYEKALLVNNTIKSVVVEYKSGSDKLAIIIDPRYDDIMEAVIQNFMYFMNPVGWNLMIVSWDGYRDIIMKKFPKCIFNAISNDDIYMNVKREPNITIETYNKILMDVDFWQKLPADDICIFQKDCIMFKMFPNYFTYYDFCGANWYTKDISLFNEGINGGFSLRNRKVMIECLEKITYDMINEYRTDALTNKSIIFETVNKEFILSPLKQNEDVFFTYACEMLRKSIPDVIHRSFLAIEANFNRETCVYHGRQYNYHGAEIAQILLRNSPLFSE